MRRSFCEAWFRRFVPSLVCAVGLVVPAVMVPNPSVAMETTDCRDGIGYLTDAESQLTVAEALVVRDPGRAKNAFIEGSREYDFAIGHWAECFRDREEVLASAVGFHERYLRITFGDSPDLIVADAQYMRFTRARLQAAGADSRFPEYWARIERYDSQVQTVANLLRIMRAKYEERR